MDQQNNPYQNNPYQQNPYYNQNIFGGGGQQPLDNATTILVLGICSIVICGLGPILGIITLVLARGARRQYEANPPAYTPNSWSNVKAGRICGIIGLCVWLAFWLFYVAYMIYVYYMVMALTNSVQEQMQNMPH
jgi:hypothetical protein